MSPSQFKQDKHKLLAIPGPIEVTDEVLEAISKPPISHVGPEFVTIFRESMLMTREVLFTQSAQVFIIAGSGTLGWDQVAANLVEPGEAVLVLNTGYFGDSFRDCLQTYRAQVDEVHTEIGASVDIGALESALKRRTYKAVTFTHVDTSTGVLSDAAAIAATVRRVSPDTLVVLDGVCSVASEEIRMDAWDIDVIMAASQKGLGAPPGLSILAASDRAMKVFESRKTPPTSYYASWKKWLPIMKAYEAGKPAYFGTPPVNLIRAYHASLTQLTKSRNLQMDERFRAHKVASARVRAIAAQLGLRIVPRSDKEAANGMTAVYYPEGVAAGELLPRLAERGVIVAGGLHSQIKDKYFRIGHMGVSVTDPARADIDTLTTALSDGVRDARASKAQVSGGNSLTKGSHGTGLHVVSNSAASASSIKP